MFKKSLLINNNNNNNDNDNDNTIQILQHKFY